MIENKLGPWYLGVRRNGIFDPECTNCWARTEEVVGGLSGPIIAAGAVKVLEGTSGPFTVGMVFEGHDNGVWKVTGFQDYDPKHPEYDPYEEKIGWVILEQIK